MLSQPPISSLAAARRSNLIKARCLSLVDAETCTCLRCGASFFHPCQRRRMQSGVFRCTPVCHPAEGCVNFRLRNVLESYPFKMQKGRIPSGLCHYLKIFYRPFPRSISNTLPQKSHQENTPDGLLAIVLTFVGCGVSELDFCPLCQAIP